MINEPCLFCRIGTGELDVATVAASDKAAAFLDLHPHAPGHTLVIPRTHAATLAELPKNEVGPLFDLVQETAMKLEEVLEAPGMTIGINQGEAAGGGIPHLHVHLMPRFHNDGNKSIHDVVKNSPTPAQQELIQTLTQ